MFLMTFEEFEKAVEAGRIYKAGDEWIEVEDPIIGEKHSHEPDEFSDLIEF